MYTQYSCNIIGKERKNEKINYYHSSDNVCGIRIKRSKQTFLLKNGHTQYKHIRLKNRFTLKIKNFGIVKHFQATPL